MKILVTGGHGFIGSNLIVTIMRKMQFAHIVNLDCETYAARPDYLKETIKEYNLKEPNVRNIKYEHINCDIRDSEMVDRVFQEYKPDYVIHLAAESHVCNSIKGPRLFMETNIMGTFNLLESFLKLNNKGRFLHVSTDEVFGELPLNAPDQKFSEETPVDPRSPYSASKASSDFIVQAYHHTYGLDTVITNCSNNYGLNQHEEKLIPKTIRAILKKEEVVIHGEGNHIRDWIFVEDHCEGILRALLSGVSGERYLFGGENEMSNLEVVKYVHEVIEAMFDEAMPLKLIHTSDRPTDDERYAIDITKARDKFCWRPTKDFRGKLRYTIAWYYRNLRKELGFVPGESWDIGSEGRV